MLFGSGRLTVASWMTLSRMFLLPVAILPVALGWNCAWSISAGITILAGVTDMLDGYVARKKGQTTQTGTNLDLLSDKVFVIGMLAFLSASGLIHAWIPSLILVRELGVSLLRRWRFGTRPPSPDLLGKAKTVASIAAIAWVLLWHDIRTGGLLASAAGNTALRGLFSLAPWVLLIAVGLTLLSGLNYAFKFSVAKDL